MFLEIMFRLGWRQYKPCLNNDYAGRKLVVQQTSQLFGCFVFRFSFVFLMSWHFRQTTHSTIQMARECWSAENIWNYAKHSSLCRRCTHVASPRLRPVKGHVAFREVVWEEKNRILFIGGRTVLSALMPLSNLILFSFRPDDLLGLISWWDLKR